MLEEYIKKEDVLKILYDTKENKDIPKNYGMLIGIIQQVRNLSPEKVISEDMGKCELAIAQNNNLHTNCNYCIELAKVEAIKEFTEELKEKAYTNNYCQEVVLKSDIENLAKEKTGDE